MIDDNSKSSISTLVPERDLGLYISDGWERDKSNDLPAPDGSVWVRRVLPTRYVIGPMVPGGTWCG